MKSLAESLLLVILSYLSNEDQVSFCKTCSLINSFQKDIKKISITVLSSSSNASCGRFFCEKRYRERVLQSIKDPSQQLKLVLTRTIDSIVNKFNKKLTDHQYSDHEDQSEDSDDDDQDEDDFHEEEVEEDEEEDNLHINVAFPLPNDINSHLLEPLQTINSLTTNYSDFLDYFVNSFIRIENLELFSDYSHEVVKFERDIIQVLTVLMFRCHSFQLRLRRLTITNTEPTNLIEIPFILGLQSLSIKFFTSLDSNGLRNYCTTLQELTISDCASIIDVSSFDSIPILCLEKCPGIVNISCLTNNERIQIENCENIIDYTRCCQASKWITFVISNSIAAIELASFEKALKIEISATQEQQILRIPKSLPSHLKSLHINGFKIFSNRFPTNSLTEIVLQDCDSVTSVEALGIIAKVKLISLRNLMSLKGLGIANQSVAVIDCQRINDFSPIRCTPEVTISNCSWFINCSDLDHVRSLRLEFIHSYLQLEQLRRLEVLTLFECSNIRFFNGLSQLKELHLSSGMMEKKKFILHHLVGCGYEKIVILSMKRKEFMKFSYQMLVRKLYHIIEHKHESSGVHEIILLKRRTKYNHQKEQNFHQRQKMKEDLHRIIKFAERETKYAKEVGLSGSVLDQFKLVLDKAQNIGIQNHLN